MSTGLVVTWNDTASSAFNELYTVKVDRGSWGANRSVDVSIPGRAGTWHFTEQRGNKGISVAFTLHSSSVAERRNELDAIFNWLDVIGRKRLVFSDQPDRYWDAAINTGPNVDEAQRLGKFMVAWEAEPYPLAIGPSEVCATGVTGTSNGGAVTMPGVISVDPEVTITPRGGTLTDILFTLNGDTITWAGSIPQNGTLTISSISSTVLLDASGDTQLVGAFDVDDLDMASASGTFGILIPGSNAWSFSGKTGTSTSLDICFKFRERLH